MTEWQIIMIERIEEFLNTGTIDELQLLTFEKYLLAGLKSPQIVDFVKKKIGSLKSNLESGKLNIGKCKKQFNIQYKYVRTDKNRNKNITPKKDSNKITNINNPQKPIIKPVMNEKSKLKGHSNKLTTNKGKGKSDNLLKHKNEKTDSNRNRNDSNKKDSFKIIYKNKTQNSVRKPRKTEELIFIHNLTSDNVIGQSFNMVAAYVGTTEFILTFYLQSKGFEIESNQKFTNDMWNTSAKFLIDSYDEKKKSKKHFNELIHNPNKCTKPNFGKLIYIGRSSK
jgi:hypothetical protein